MMRRLEKYYFVTPFFFSLFTIKFVRYIDERQNTHQVGTKNAYKIRRKFRYILEVSDIYTTNYTLKLEQKTPTKYVGNFRYNLVNMSQVGNLAEVSCDFRDIIS